MACDLPLVTAALFERLGEFTSQAEPPPIEAVVPIQNDGRPQPLCALYRRTCRSEAEKLIANGERTPRALLDRVITRFIQFDEISDLGRADHFFFNVNPPENYERAKQILEAIRDPSWSG